MTSPQFLLVAGAAFTTLSLVSSPISGQQLQPWPPTNPDEQVTKTPFTVAWAKKVRGFQNLAELQEAAGSKGRVSSTRGMANTKHPSVTFHWRSQPTPNARPGWMIAEVYADDAVGADIITNDDLNIIINTFGAFICEKCSPPVNALGMTPTWAR